MSFQRFRVSFVFRLLLFFCVSSSLWSRELSFRETLKLAVEKSPSLEVARRELSIGALEQSNAFSAFLPSLNLTSAHGFNDSDPAIKDHAASSEFSLQLKETLYDNGLSLTQYRNAKLKRHVAEISFKDQRDKLCLQVGQKYFVYSLQRHLFEAQKSQLEILKKQYNVVSSQYQQGIKTRKDYLKFKTELRRADLELESSVGALNNAQLDLLELLGLNEEDSQLLSFLPVEVGPDATDFPTDKPDIKKHFRFRAADLQRLIDENTVDIARREYWPELFLSAGANYGASDYWRSGKSYGDTDGQSWNVSLNLNFNIWDWGIKRRNVAIAREQQVISSKTLDMNLNSLRADNERLMNELQRAKNGFLLSKELLDLESSSYGFQVVEYRNGRLPYLDFIFGLRDLLDAKVKMYTSYYDLQTKILTHHYHEGTLYESIEAN